MPDVAAVPSPMGPRCRGSLIWLVGGPSVGKSSIARAIQRSGDVDHAWVLAGDHHFLRVVAADQVVRHVGVVDDEWPGWAVPFVDGRVVGPPHAGPVARRLLEGMYRAAAAMAAAGNDVVLEDVVWEAAIADLARTALASTDVFVVKVVCPVSLALARERDRPDRFIGSVTAFTAVPELIPDVAMTIDTGDRSASDCARDILGRLAERTSGEQP